MVGKPYPPLSLVVVRRVWLVSLWRIVTVAPSTTAPVPSVTLPRNVPYRACAVHVRGAEKFKFKRVARLTGHSPENVASYLEKQGRTPFRSWSFMLNHLHWHRYRWGLHRSPPR